MSDKITSDLKAEISDFVRMSGADQCPGEGGGTTFFFFRSLVLEARVQGPLRPLRGPGAAPRWRVQGGEAPRKFFVHFMLF